MPDPGKKDKKQLDDAESSADVVADVESGPPPLESGKTEVEAAAEKASQVGKVAPEAQEEPAENTDQEPEESEEPDEQNDPEEPKETPPDLVPDPDEEAAKTEPEDDTTSYDDAKTDEVIDEIIAKESDDLLSIQDQAAGKVVIKPSKKRGVLGRFLRSKVFWNLFVLLILAGVGAVMATPKTRYMALNAAGVRSSSSVVVVDSTTNLPLKGVHITLGGQKADTDSDGEAKFSSLRLGPAELDISQVGFERVRKTVTLGWGSNPLGNVALKATGVKYIIEVKDYLSDKPVAGVEATDGAVTAISDKDGKITLSLRSAVVAKDGITLSKQGYRTDKITLNEDPKKATQATLVLGRKAVFVTRQSGKYALNKSDIDGKNREVLLPGTGHENSNISVAVSPDGQRAAYVSTRANKRDDSGFLLSSLVLVNIETGATTTIAEASQIQLIAWDGQRIVFQLSTSDDSDSDRYTLSSYNYTNNSRLKLAAANELNAVVSAQGYVYYAIGSGSAADVGMFRVKADGAGKERLVDEEITTVLRSGYDTLSLQTEDGSWLSYDIPDGVTNDIDSPSSLANRLYLDNGSRNRSLWVSQGTLKSYDIGGRKDSDVKSQSGLTYPLQWLSDTVAIYRVSTGSETADYVVSVEGGKAQKVADVTPTYGFAQGQ